MICLHISPLSGTKSMPWGENSSHTGTFVSSSLITQGSQTSNVITDDILLSNVEY